MDGAVSSPSGDSVPEGVYDTAQVRRGGGGRRAAGGGRRAARRRADLGLEQAAYFLHAAAGRASHREEDAPER
ncbi:hypothetical protein EYF80_065403 [Liparis tanakae]|uniref:Uncharacterized protein n=1 Tax=Liparis tanakae TaxID=230148 RepID=A0A4Z2E6T6_9TELE|nr:hypothetical protein EYF80_065403 [Liparis tanakae]